MTTGFKTRDLSYIDLIAEFPPRKITNETELMATYARINSILDKKISIDAKEYLKILCDLVYDYEEMSEEMPELKGPEMLIALLEEENIAIKNLIPIFKNESEVLKYLEGKKNLTKKQIKELAEFFQVSEAVFEEGLSNN